MRRADDDRLDPRSGNRIDTYSLFVDGYRNKLNACEAGGDSPGFVVAGVFEGNSIYAESCQTGYSKVEALGEAGTDHDAFGIDSSPAYPAQIARQHLA
jgi:hypothetical protein